MTRTALPLALCVVVTFGCVASVGPEGEPDGAVASVSDGGTVPSSSDAGTSSGNDGGTTTTPSTLSEKYPGDAWDTTDPALIVTSKFETGLDGWQISSYTGDPGVVVNDPAEANTGSGVLKLSFTLTDLQSRGDASVHANARFASDTGEYYVRYYMRYQDGTARPHHANGTRMYAPGFDQGGTAGIRPDGDERFNTTVDIDAQGRHFFYTYWHEMRSGRCNDGSATPGCAGDQGVTYYYGNRFKPANQTVIDRYQWNCYEYKVKANTPNEYDGEQALWINDQLVGEFKTGTPMGAWLRDNFYTEGEYGTADDQVPFEGYNFRTSTAVNQVRVTMQLYQEWGTLSNNRDDTPNKTEEQAVFYDDVVIARQRIGCTVP